MSDDDQIDFGEAEDFTEEDAVFEEGPEVDVSKDIQILDLKHFDLKDLEDTFDIADFERRVNKSQVRKIADAIMEKHFYDNLITVIRASGKYTVIDGQHRILALKLCRDEHGLKHYNLILRIFSEDAREIYRRINSGRPLTTMDFLKSLDDGNNPFFTDFSVWCTHYPGRHRKLTYVNLANALLHIKTGGKNFIDSKNLADCIASITAQERKSLQEMFGILDKVLYMNKKLIHFKSPVFWNIVKVWMEGVGRASFEAGLAKVENDEIIIETASSGRQGPAMQTIYFRIKELMK